MKLVSKNTRGSVLGMLAAAAGALNLHNAAHTLQGWDEARQERHRQRQMKKWAKKPRLTCNHITVAQHAHNTAHSDKAQARQARRWKNRQIQTMPAHLRGETLRGARAQR